VVKDRETTNIICSSHYHFDCFGTQALLWHKIMAAGAALITMARRVQRLVRAPFSIICTLAPKPHTVCA